MSTINPALQKQLFRFKRNRRGYYSFILLTILFSLSLLSVGLSNNKPLVMKFEGSFYFPLFKYYPANTFGEEVETHINYRKFRATERFMREPNWMILPPIPFSPTETVDLLVPPPSPPSSQNWLGTDDRGRDLLSRLIYGFRNSMTFALVSTFLIVIFSYTFGSLQGYAGGRVDLYGQRFTEIWSSLPVLYVIIFLLSIFNSNLLLITFSWVAFSWVGLSSYIRAEVLRARELDYVTAARALGVGTGRILFRHILPNTLTPIITFTPFLISAGIGSLAALDYLGLGLPPPAASWGELLRQGKENLRCWWLAFFPFLSLFLTLLLLNFVGEAVRSAFDAREG